MEEKLVLEYIGKDVNKFTDAKVNVVAAVLGQALGPVWFFYRKAYLLGFAFLIATDIIGRMLVTLGITEGSIIMFFIYLVTANKLYLWDARRKVKKIESSMQVSEEELVDIVRKKGGTSITAAVIYVVAMFAFLALMIFGRYLLISALLQ